MRKKRKCVWVGPLALCCEFGHRIHLFFYFSLPDLIPKLVISLVLGSPKPEVSRYDDFKPSYLARPSLNEDMPLPSLE